MSQELTPRQQAALDKIRAQGNVAGIDKGMVQALVKKGHLEPALLPKPAAARIPKPDIAHPFREAREQACLDVIEKAFQTAEAHFGKTFERPKINFTNRMKTTAGNAKWFWGPDSTVERPEINLSAHLLRLNGDEFIARTPGHEAAHIIAVQQFGRHGNGHGRYWKMVMRIIGQNPERCHNMKVMPTQKGRLFKYRATCGTIVELKSGRHNKIKRGMTYTLKSTRGKISFDGFLGMA